MTTDRDDLLAALAIHKDCLVCDAIFRDGWVSAEHLVDTTLETDWLKNLRKRVFEEGRTLGFAEGVSDANDEDPWEGTNPYA